MRWIVVGAGSAGCVVAARLALHGDHEVVLLDDGPATPPEVRSDSFFDSLAEPGRTFPSLTAVKVDGTPPTPYRRGRGLGGSGAVNAMVALRGGPFDAPHLLPVEPARQEELGPVDRALLAAADDARPAPLTRRNGRRVTTADAYLGLVPSDGRLAVHGDATVDRVLFDGDRAVGVRLADGRDVFADRIVLCAGAIHTPTILLRSRRDLPGVGEGLQDHPSAPITLELHPDALADPSSLAVGALLERDPVQVLPINHLGPGAASYGLLMPALMRVRSRGRVRLDPEAPDDPTRDPVVELGMLRDRGDVEGMVRAVRVALDLVDAAPFREIVVSAYVDAHGTTTDSLTHDAAVERWLPDHVGDYVHASSTCAMGRVVDDRGAVHGTEGVFVCDASVFREVPHVNTHLPVVMLAETLTARWLGRATPGA